jgi:hypothetical protein
VLHPTFTDVWILPLSQGFLVIEGPQEPDMLKRSSILAGLVFSLLAGCGSKDLAGSQCSVTSDCADGLVCTPTCDGCTISVCYVACQADGGQCALGHSCQPMTTGGPSVCSL